MAGLVVVGLGYVGLPLVREACGRGVGVTGLDVSAEVVDLLNGGRSHVDDISDADVATILDQGFVATTEPGVVAEADSVVLCVPTPLSAEGGPDLAAVVGACRAIGPHLRPDTLVVLESTTYPGTTAEVVQPLLEELSGLTVADGLHVAYSPERIDPGNARFGLHNTPKIVGADTEEASARARDLYRRIVDEVVVARGTREAESAKLLENTYRHVNIALVNEMARFFHELDIDFWDVIGLAATKPFGFQSFTPGPGVGGHCIPIDPNYLSHRVRSQLGYSFRFVELAQEINSGMPAYVVQRAVELLNGEALAARGSRVLLLGLTYKRDIADQRESPAVEVAQRLLDMGAEVLHSDPHVPDWTLVPEAKPAGADAVAAAREADLVILLQDHSGYDLDEITAGARLFLDTRGAASGSGVTRL
jgi:nucleotide sugar dehydrogenase